MDENSEPFYIERAKGGRANCRGCRAPCLAGELRMAKIGVGPYGDGKPMKFWYHMDCMMDAFYKQRPATRRIQTTSDIGNFRTLSSEDKDIVLNKLNEMESRYAQKNNLDVKIIEDESDVVPSSISPSTSRTVPKYDTNHRDNKFDQFCQLCVDISGDDKYTAKTAIVRKFFSDGTDGTGLKSDVALWCRLLLPRAIKRVYNLKSKQLVKLFSRIFNTNLRDMIEDLEQGNVGETIVKFFEKSKMYSTVSTITVFEVDQFLERLSGLTKEEEQTNHFNSIVEKCTPRDMKYLIYLINGDLRINAGPKHILEAVHPDAHKVFESSRDIDVVISKVLNTKDPVTAIASPIKVHVKAEVLLMKPIQPMLAEACKSIEMAMEKCKNGMLSEIKYDGERVQLHKSGSEFRYYSRSLKPVLDHKVARFKEFIPKAFPHGNDMILDSEILMMDTHTGQPLPFGSLGIHKKNEFQNAEVCLIVFDCIYYNGRSLINEPIHKRREVLEKNMTEIKNHVMISEVKAIHRADELKDMIIKVLKLGLEGLVLKDLQSTYEPGKRHWLKVKKDYLFDGAMADSADLVVLGAWFGTGKKGGMLSVFLMGCYDDAKNQWVTVTKVHTGHDDDTLESLQEPLKANMSKISQDSALIPAWFRCTKTMVPDFIAKDPKKQPVWEISGTEFTKAQIHTADGISIRFPRVTKIRNDKSWTTATSLKELKDLFIKSKQHTDLSLLEGDSSTKDSLGDTCNMGDIGLSKRLSVDSTIIDSTMSSSKVSTNRKRPLKTILNYCDVETKPKKAKVSTVTSENVGDDDNNSGPMSPLPDVFVNCKIKFHKGGKESNVREYIRYIEAYGGKMDATEDGSEATHVVHFGNEMKMKELSEPEFNYSKTARHVTIDWLNKSIYLKALQNPTSYPVHLIN